MSSTHPELSERDVTTLCCLQAFRVAYFRGEDADPAREPGLPLSYLSEAANEEEVRAALTKLVSVGLAEEWGGQYKITNAGMDYATPVTKVVNNDPRYPGVRS